jgi:hypothetical protein
MLGHTVQHPGADTDAAGGDAAASTRALGRQMPDDGGTGRRHPLAGDAVVRHRQALEKQGRRRRRDGQAAMRGAHPAAPQRQRCGAPALRIQPVDQPSRGQDVGVAVPVGDLVEMHLVDRHAVHLGLGLGQQAVDRQRVRLRTLRQSRRLDPSGDRDMHARRRCGLRNLDREP